VSTRAALARNGLVSSVQGLNQQSASIREQIRQINTQIADLTAQLVNTPFFGQAPIVARLTSLEARLTSLQIRQRRLPCSGISWQPSRDQIPRC